MPSKLKSQRYELVVTILKRSFSNIYVSVNAPNTPYMDANMDFFAFLITILIAQMCDCNECEMHSALKPVSLAAYQHIYSFVRGQTVLIVAMACLKSDGFNCHYSTPISISTVVWKVKWLSLFHEVTVALQLVSQHISGKSTSN